MGEPKRQVRRLKSHSSGKVPPLLLVLAMTPLLAAAPALQPPSLCHLNIPGVPRTLPVTQQPFRGSPVDWASIAQAISQRRWSDAKLAFERSSAFRARAYTGVHEPADTLFREGSYHDAFVSYYQLAFCSAPTPTLSSSDRVAAPLYRAALEAAIAGRYQVAKATLMKDVTAHPTFLLGKNTIAELYAITSSRDDSRAGWQHVVLAGRLAPSGRPNDESLDAAEMLLFADRGIIAETAGVSDIKITDPVASPRPLAPQPLATSTSLRTPAVAGVSFDVVTSWSDAPPTNAHGLQYYHIRVSLHPTNSTVVRARDFTVDGMAGGNTVTYAGLQGTAPMVAKVSSDTGRAVTSYAPAVDRAEDLGTLYNLRMDAGEKKTVVITFAVPATATLSEEQLRAVRWAQ